MISKILVANRGEIAIRIMRACQEMGIASVAVYSEADRTALHVALADEAVLIGAAPASESYLNIEHIVAAARQTHCDAVHPGYGFLSERAEFAQSVHDAGLTFVGPSPQSIQAMGSKTRARQLMQAASVPVVPGYQRDGDLSGLEDPTGLNPDREFFVAAERLGYPLMVKAVAGGGGKGMRVVRRADELRDALDSARREAEKAFGDASVYLERLLDAPHHVEFQIMADQHGATLHLLERECSVQRRHQKIVEETPSPLMTAALRARMGEAAVAAARAVGYVNAGTIEFLVDAERNFYFLEMNTRLQVEHPISEALTGLDLVKWQIRIAAGEPLPFVQSQIQARGHAMECRIYAEDAANHFLPSTGRVLFVAEPRAPGVRVDAGIAAGSDVTRFYDPLIAKVIAHAETRAEAIARMERALADYTILGVTTNIPFLRALLATPQFQRGEVTTNFVDEHFADWAPRLSAPDEALVAAALSEASAHTRPGADQSDGAAYDPWLIADGYRVAG